MPAPSVTLTITERLLNHSKATTQTDALAASLSGSVGPKSADKELGPMMNDTDEFDEIIGQSVQSVASTHGIHAEEDDTEVGKRFREAVTGIKSDDLVIPETRVIASTVVDKVLDALVSAATGGGADSVNSLDKMTKRNLKTLVRKGLASIASDQSRGVDALTITERMMSDGN